MPTLARSFALGSTAAAVLTLLAACGSSTDDASDGGSPELSITSPAEDANVGSTFKVTWTSNVELGEPDTGRDHVHVFVDGQANDYTVVGGKEFTIKDLSFGEHTVNVTLQHADHSAAGAEDEIDVNVGASGSTDETTPTPDDTDSSDPGGYDY